MGVFEWMGDWITGTPEKAHSDIGMRLMGDDPPTIPQVVQHIENLCEWMRTPGRIVYNTGRLTCRLQEMFYGIFGINPILVNPSDLPSFLSHSAELFEAMIPTLSDAQTTKWRPWPWNYEIMDDLIRERREDAQL